MQLQIAYCSVGRMFGLTMWADFTPDVPRFLDALSFRGVGPTLELMRTAY